MLRAKIRDNLRTARRVNTTTDIWAQKLSIHSYLGLTAHYVNTKEKRRQSIRLGLSFFRVIKNFMTFLSACRQFDTAHTGLAIADKLMEVLKEYGIENKTFHCLTDSASNMIKGSSSNHNDFEHNLH